VSEPIDFITAHRPTDPAWRSAAATDPPPLDTDASKLRAPWSAAPLLGRIVVYVIVALFAVLLGIGFVAVLAQVRKRVGTGLV